MRLRIVLPTAILADASVRKVTAGGLHGSFTVLPRHVDFLAALVPGLLAYEPPAGGERFAAVDGGLLVKYGADVLISTHRAVSRGRSRRSAAHGRHRVPGARRA